MSVSYEFLNEEINLGFSSTEDMANFIIKHYGKLMKTYRVMKAQEKATKNKHEFAHEQLNEIRIIRNSKMVLTDQQEEELTEKYKKYTKDREANDIHCYKHEALEIDHLTTLIMKHKWIMIALEACDYSARSKAEDIAPAMLEKILTPFRYIIREGFKLEPNKKNKDKPLLKFFRNLFAGLPEELGDYIHNSMEIDLDEHRDINSDGDKEYYIEL